MNVSEYIYLDWNSYGLICPNILELMKNTWLDCVNTSSKHHLGQQSKKKFRELNAKLGNFLGLSNQEQNCSLFDQIIYTSGATESNIMLLKQYPKVFVSDIEHPSIRNCPQAQIIPVDINATMDLNYLEDQIKEIKPPFLVSYMLANHETGIINEVRPVVALTHKYGGHFHTDATQAFGRIPFNFADLQLDYMTIASHKVGGPIGIGALVTSRPVPLITWDLSGRAGTVPLPLIAGLVASTELKSCRNEFLESFINPDIIIGNNLARLPNTTCIKCQNKDELMMLLDLNKICVSSGAACTQSSADKAHSLQAMGISMDTIRISSGWSTNQDDLRTCAAVLNEYIG